jgi:hypothetical protein
MLTGQAKTDYQRDYMAKRRLKAKNKVMLLSDQKQGLENAPEKESELRQAYEQTSLGWQSANLKIVNKKAQLVPFVHNKAQLKVHNVMALQQKHGLPIKIIILKARKRGISTYIEACIFEKINRRKNVHGCVASMDKVSTNKVFKMAETFQTEMPTDRKIETERSNRQEILYKAPHRSSLLCQTAGTTTLGRGGDTHYVHATEVPYWKNAESQLTGLLNEVPSNDPDTMVVIEGTANGTGGSFYKEYWAAVDRLRGLYNADGSINPTALAGFVPVFLSWQDEEEYQTALPKGCKAIPENLMTDEIKAYVAEGLEMGIELSREQLYYAILTIQNNCGGDISRFKAEYPRTAREAFQSTGRMVFKPTDLDWMEKWCKPAIDYIEFYYDKALEKIKYRRVDRQVNCWAVWRYPQEGHNYVCFGDVAEGVLSDPNDSKSDPDRSVAAILDRGEYDVPMTYYGRPNTIEYADQMLYASVFFNYAWASPEMNSIGQSVLDTFKRAEYEFIYIRSRGEQTANVEDSDLLGWKTTTLTKKPMIADLQEVISEHSMRVYDIRFIDELRVFIWNPQGKPMAEKSEHDDAVITLAGLIQLHQRCPIGEDLSFADDIFKPSNPVAVMGAVDKDDDDDDNLDGLYESETERLAVGIDDENVGELG